MRVVDYQASPLCHVARKLKLLSPWHCDALELTTLPVACNIDRSGTLDFGINHKVLDPIPAPALVPQRFDELMDARAQELIATGEPLNVFWSGGMDSTGVLCALLRNRVPRGQLRVVFTHASMAEYPRFFLRYVTKLPQKLCRPSLLSEIDWSQKLVTGEIGDQLFGSVILNEYADYGACLDTHWTEHIRKMYPVEWHKPLFAFYHPFTLAAPFPINSIYDFLWWFNFACKYQHVVMRIAHAAPDLDQFLTNVRHFYRTDAFQQWSMNEDNHRKHKTGRRANTYKLALRNYIFSYTNDKDYLTNKKKIGSLPLKFADRFMMLLDTGERIRFGGRMCDDAAEYEARYGDRYNSLFRKLPLCTS